MKGPTDMATKRVSPVQTDESAITPAEILAGPEGQPTPEPQPTPAPVTAPATDAVPSLVGMTGESAAAHLLAAAYHASLANQDVATLVHDAVRPLATKARAQIMAAIMPASIAGNYDPTLAGQVGQAVASAPTGPDPRVTLGQMLDNAALVLGQGLKLAAAPSGPESDALVAAIANYAAARGIEPTDAHTNQAERWLAVGGRGSGGNAREGGLTRTNHGRRIDSLTVGTRLDYRGVQATVVAIDDAAPGTDAAGVMIDGDTKVYRSMTDAAKVVNRTTGAKSDSVNGWQAWRVDGTRTSAAARVDGRAGIAVR
jgi:hypothetical protein